MESPVAGAPDFLWLIVLLVQAGGVLSAIDALFWVRSAQGAVAWCVALVFMPWLSLPLYWVFGRSRFQGYRSLTAEFVDVHRQKALTTAGLFSAYADYPREVPSAAVFEVIAGSPFLGRNSVRLLIDGDETFRALFEALDRAKQYILLECYIIRDDALGEKLKAHLLAAKERGVRSYVLYDEIGCATLPDDYFDDVIASGVDVASFDTTRGPGNRFQLNFRNHRKIVVVDGAECLIGGHNVGEEYLGQCPDLSPWRDTHILVRGPSVMQAQAAFFADWLWAKDEKIQVAWTPAAGEGGTSVLIMASGPGDAIEKWRLFFIEAANSARKRLWVASPYFVPDETVLSALQLAALRGVDVRILLPQITDNRAVDLAGRLHTREVCRFGARVFKYTAGFLHEKAMLVDDSISVVSTANLDNRSFRLNFEASVIVAGPQFAGDVAAMFEHDFKQSRECFMDEFDAAGFWERAAARGLRLFEPVL